MLAVFRPLREICLRPPLLLLCIISIAHLLPFASCLLSTQKPPHGPYPLRQRPSHPATSQRALSFAFLSFFPSSPPSCIHAANVSYNCDISQTTQSIFIPLPRVSSTSQLLPQRTSRTMHIFTHPKPASVASVHLDALTTFWRSGLKVSELFWNTHCPSHTKSCQWI